MVRFVAFFRGINVGGHAVIAMPALEKIFESCGFSNITTYIQSGNVAFDSKKSAPSVARDIEKQVSLQAGIKARVIIKSSSDLANLMITNPFRKRKFSDIQKWYVSFLADPPAIKISLPLLSPHNDVELISQMDDTIFSIARKVKGKFGFPNLLVEHAFEVPATTRNWNTIEKVSGI